MPTIAQRMTIRHSVAPDSHPTEHDVVRAGKYSHVAEIMSERAGARERERRTKRGREGERVARRTGAETEILSERL